MKICALTYDHPHEKTAKCLSAMWLCGVAPSVIWAAPWKEKGARLDFNYHPITYADKMGAKYIVKAHNAIIEHRCDIGVILGARILPQSVIDSFSLGIINIHPGRLPESRGLNAYEIERELDGNGRITAHFINAKVDSGLRIAERIVPKYDDDTFEAFVYRMNAAQPPLLIDAISLISTDMEFEAI